MLKEWQAPRYLGVKTYLFFGTSPFSWRHFYQPVSTRMDRDESYLVTCIRGLKYMCVLFNVRREAPSSEIVHDVKPVSGANAMNVTYSSENGGWQAKCLTTRVLKAPHHQLNQWRYNNVAFGRDVHKMLSFGHKWTLFGRLQLILFIDFIQRS